MADEILVVDFRLPCWFTPCISQQLVGHGRQCKAYHMYFYMFRESSSRTKRWALIHFQNIDPGAKTQVPYCAGLTLLNRNRDCRDVFNNESSQKRSRTVIARALTGSGKLGQWCSFLVASEEIEGGNNYGGCRSVERYLTCSG